MKICNSDGCNNSVFGGGFCKFHQYKRQEKNKPIVSTSINSFKEKKIKAKSKASGQLTLFKEVWNERAHVSELSGDKISMFDVFCFHHILTKAAYPKFLLFKPNIIILTRAEHRMVHDHSFEDLIKKDIRWAEIERRYNILKTMYNNAE